MSPQKVACSAPALCGVFRSCALVPTAAPAGFCASRAAFLAPPLEGRSELAVAIRCRLLQLPAHPGPHCSLTPLHRSGPHLRPGVDFSCAYCCLCTEEPTSLAPTPLLPSVDRPPRAAWSFPSWRTRAPLHAVICLRAGCRSHDAHSCSIVCDCSPDHPEPPACTPLPAPCSLSDSTRRHLRLC